jgi:hypothetical protein
VPKSQLGSASPVVAMTLCVDDIHETMEQMPKCIPFDITSANTNVLPAEYCLGIQITFEQRSKAHENLVRQAL